LVQDAGWKKKGILDSDIDEHEYAPANDYEVASYFIHTFIGICPLL